PAEGIEQRGRTATTQVDLGPALPERAGQDPEAAAVGVNGLAAAIAGHDQNGGHRPPPSAPAAALTSARMPARIGSGRVGQASMTAARSGGMGQSSLGK